MLDALIPENLAAQLVIAAGKMPKLYTLNLDKSDGVGRCPENGTILCPECFGMWAPELLARAITHVDRGACNREKAERESREVPFRPENMRILLNIKIPEPAPAGPETFRGFMPWGAW
jgi:hypothetical protein